jgi:hypothetical protein
LLVLRHLAYPDGGSPEKAGFARGRAVLRQGLRIFDNMMTLAYKGGGHEEP